MSTTPLFKGPRRPVIVLGLIAFILLVWWWFHRAPTKLEQYRAKLLAEGEILDLDKFAPRRTGNEPDGDEPLIAAAKKLSQGLSSLPGGAVIFAPGSNGFWRMTWQNDTNRTNGSQSQLFWNQAPAELELKRGDLQILRLALANPPHEKGADYRNPGNYPKGHISFRRSLAQFLHTAIIVDARAGHAAQAGETTLALLNLVDWHRDEMMISEQINRRRMSQLAGFATAYGIQAQIWDEPTLKKLQGRWENVALVTNFFRLFLYDRTVTLDAFSKARTDPEDMRAKIFSSKSTALSDRFWQFWWFNFGMDDDELLFLQRKQASLDIWRTMIQSPNWSEGLTELKALEEEWEYLSSDEIKAKRYRMNHLTSMLWTQSTIALIRAEILRQQTITAIALERYRLIHGHHPRDFSNLVPDFLARLPQDQMNGQPMRYRLNQDGTYALYSVGLDGQDNGGSTAKQVSLKLYFPDDTLDLVWPRIDPLDLHK